MIKALAAVAAVVTLAGPVQAQATFPADQGEAARQLARDTAKALPSQLRDYESAKFQGWKALFYVDKKNRPVLQLCGEINSKNGFGGYSGFRQFAAHRSASGQVWLSEGGAWCNVGNSAWGDEDLTPLVASQPQP